MTLVYVVYVAGEYRARTLFGVLLNIFRARRVAVRLWKSGYSVISPHMNTCWMSEPPTNLDARILLRGGFGNGQTL